MTRYAMCLNVRGFLKTSKFPRQYKGMFKHDDGRSMTPEEARDCLMDELAKGHEVIPFSKQCCNPCSMPKCAGFDYSGGGCPGWEPEPGPEPAA